MRQTDRQTHSSYGGEEFNNGSWWGDLKDGDHLEDPGADVGEGIILKWIFKKCDGRAHTGLIWLKVQANAGHL